MNTNKIKEKCFKIFTGHSEKMLNVILQNVTIVS
jgi:hypothetical protein